MAYTAPTIVASGTTFAQFQAGGPAQHIAKLIAAQAATLAPTAAATATATGGGSTGGSLAAGTYYFVFTETNGIGETTKSPEGSQLTVGATNIPRFTFPTLKAGNAARRLYLGAVGGSTGGPYTLYASGITTTTYDASAAAVANSYAVNPPAVNSTGLSFANATGATMNTTLQYLETLLRNPTNMAKAWNDAVLLVDQFNRGQPVPWNQVEQKLRHSHTFFAMLATAFAEMGTLIDANPGTLATVETGIGTRKAVRQWP